MNPRIFLATCDRKPAYVHDALKSMLADRDVREVNVMVCGASQTKFLDRWRSETRVVIHEASDLDKRIARRGSTEQRILYTFLRALEMARPDDLVIFTEDDTSYAKNWLGRTMEFVRLIKARKDTKPDYKNRFVLAICSLYCLKAERNGLAPYHPSDFHCTAGFALEGWVALEIAKYARAKLAKREFLASDMMIKRFAWETPCELLACSPSLVDHVGDQSTQGFFAIRRAPSFRT